MAPPGRARRRRPRARRVIDSHTHLDLCEPPDAELVAAAEAAGVRRILTVGIDGASCRAALAAAEDFPQVYAAVGRHPNSSRGFDDADLAELCALAAHERCVAIGETGLDFYRETAPPPEDQQRAFAAQIELARQTGKPLVIHSRAADQQTLDQLGAEAAGVSVVMHCFSMPAHLEECLARGYAISFAGNVTYPSAGDLQQAARAVPQESLLVETDAPFLTPQAVRRERNQPAYVAHTLAFVAALRGVSEEELGAAVEDNAARVFGWSHPAVEGSPPAGGRVSAVGEAPTQASLRRMRRFGVRPDRELGQNFLIDSNILGVIERAAMLSGDDVVLEIGGGLGVLSEHLAERAAAVHVIEVDERLREPLLEATAPYPNAQLHWGDAMSLDLGALDPAPTKVVANLPYGIAASALLRTIDELPSVGLWVAMTQREVGERLAARPGAPGKTAYGAPSVLAQLACEVRVLRAIPRTVFHPVPNVDSVLVEMRRRAGAEPAPGAPSREALRALIAGAFAHRRKTLAGSLAIAGGAGGAGRERVRDAVVQLGHPPDVRAERLEPEEFRALAEMLGL